MGSSALMTFAVQFVAAWLHRYNVLCKTQLLFSLITITVWFRGAWVTMLAQTNKLVLILYYA